MIQAVFGDYFLDACVLAPRSEGRSQTMHSVALERVAFECFAMAMSLSGVPVRLLQTDCTG